MTRLFWSKDNGAENLAALRRMALNMLNGRTHSELA